MQESHKGAISEAAAAAAAGKEQSKEGLQGWNAARTISNKDQSLLSNNLDLFRCDESTQPRDWREKSGRLFYKLTRLGRRTFFVTWLRRSCGQSGTDSADMHTKIVMFSACVG
jgi:hypothetical protein